MATINEVKLFLGKKRNIEGLIKNCDLSFIDTLINNINEARVTVAQQREEELKKEAENEEKLKRVKEFMDTLGLDPKTVIIANSNNKKKSKKSRVIPVKYQLIINNETFTWSGVGRMPKWLNQQLKDGHNIDEFLINN